MLKNTETGMVGWLSSGVVLVLFPLLAHGVTIDELKADRDGDTFDVAARLVIDAPHEAAYEAATDFESLPDYSPMVESAHLKKDNRLDSKTRVCIVGFCKTVKQVMTYELDSPDHIDMKVVKGKGNLKSGTVHWTFEATEDDQTEVHFKTRIVPDFWVPPLVGSWAVKRVVRDQVGSTAEAIENLVKEKRKSGDHKEGT